MKIQLLQLVVNTKETTEVIRFSETVTFLHGPVSTGKSTIARLIDFCLDGNLERTPAIQQEFISAELLLMLGEHETKIERALHDNQRVRVSWVGPGDESYSVSAPFTAQSEPLIDAEVYNLSDLLFHLCGINPIKVRQRTRDPDSPLIRLGFRDVWWYCYLDQLHLDSSFFRLDDPYKGRKSQDAMRFFTGLHSDRLNQLEIELMRTLDDQRSKREAVAQIRSFMERFKIGSELDVLSQLQSAQDSLDVAEISRHNLEESRTAQTHPSDDVRDKLRQLGANIEDMKIAVIESKEVIHEQESLRAELITAKLKANRIEQAGRILDGVNYTRCPECSTNISERVSNPDACQLCGSITVNDDRSPMAAEALRRDFNSRIDQVKGSIYRRKRAVEKMYRKLAVLLGEKVELDLQLQEELSRYDSAYVESIRKAEREIATYSERIRSLKQLQEMPQAINNLQEEAGALQGKIDRFRNGAKEERLRLRRADAMISKIASEFKRVMLSVSFPGVTEDDDIFIDTRNWKPTVVHGEQAWTFWDTGSGGKKTLFNVCYALAIHIVAIEYDLPVPSVLIIDSPTKNISEDENPELVRSLYDKIYRVARDSGSALQFLLIDSELVTPSPEVPGFIERRMSGDPESPALIPYYDGP